MSRPSLERTLFWTMTVACFAAALACLGARAIDKLAARALAERQGYLMVRVIAPEGAEGLSVAASVLGADPRIDRVEIMTARRAAELLGSWGVGDAGGADLPPLRLIEAILAPNAVFEGGMEADIHALLADQGVTAEAIGPPADPRAGQAARLRRAGLLGALGLSAVMALIVALSARALASRRRDLITVMADLGARRREACLKVADEAGAVGFLAGFLGACAAGGAGLALVLAVFPDLTSAALAGLITPADIAPLIAAPFLAALAAGVGARLGAESLYARATRLG